MKKYVITSSALVLAMLICLTTSHATTHIQSMFVTATLSQDAPPKGLMGKVVAVDTAKNELAVKDEKGTEKTMAVAPTTKITKEGKDIALADIKTGDRVMYELDAASGPPVAKSLLVMSVKSARP
jgi:hypothetical protein